MSLTIPTCPHCGAPLVTSRFAATVVCSYCAATVRIDPTVVQAEKYRQAWKAWTAPPAGGGSRLLSIGDDHWTVERLLAHGETSEVYLARRARWPPELALFKVLRDDRDAPLLEQEWQALSDLHRRAAERQVSLSTRVPLPLARGILDGAQAGRPAVVYRWAPGFVHTFEAVRAAYPTGIPPVASIWAWRRILEILTMMESVGLAHAAVLPNHLLIETGEHGVRLVGFACAGAPGSALRVVSKTYQSFYPAQLLDGGKLDPRSDVAMSARCIGYLLGEDPGGALPAAVPGPLAELVEEVASAKDAGGSAWDLRQQLGEMAKSLFGPPAFHPIAMVRKVSN
jgi:hypothetical protein